ncbi:potassium channel family protein [Acetivibrio clariflavus]|uniref:Trk system potassium uptake protein TrkA n=1 Tax=Acetivibrio clariflavus (strain DSM 19732 / NBRC 101661 / EBR45) TaxID=720554 RepID=G8LSQ9_ACECE|nr:TrkA family potassium uptake protein [Acetivibrio clariflavus]AEV69411.1 K+ transport system, NAD-binding component [Acetivibrio clariflavus DSM 19732]
MYIIVAGGGKLGYYLIKTLLSYKHKVVVIESKVELCEKLANELNIPAFNGNATDLDILTQVEAEKADTFIAVTGKDEDNLIACQLAKRNFGVKRTIARVNNPKNIEVFQKLGVDFAVSSTSIIADLIEQEVDYTGMKTLMKLRSGKLVLSEITINENSPVVNKSLKDIKIPKDCIIISLIRDEEVIIPNGFTVLRDKDYIITVSSKEDQDELKEFFLGKKRIF